MTDTKKPEQICKSDGLYNNAELLLYSSESNLLRDKLKLANDELEAAYGAYEHILWLYAEGICHTSPERLEYLMTIELPFHLKPAMLVDLKLFVDTIIAEHLKDYPQKVAA